MQLEFPFVGQLAMMISTTEARLAGSKLLYEQLFDNMDWKMAIGNYVREYYRSGEVFYIPKVQLTFEGYEYWY